MPANRRMSSRRIYRLCWRMGALDSEHSTRIRNPLCVCQRLDFSQLWTATGNLNQTEATRTPPSGRRLLRASDACTSTPHAASPGRGSRSLTRDQAAVLLEQPLHGGQRLGPM